MKHRFRIWHVVVAITGVVAVVALLWCYTVLASILPYTINTIVSMFVLLAALLGFCVFRTFTRWKQIGMWRRTYTVVTVVVLSSLLVAFVFVVAQDSEGMFSPKCIWAVWRLERLGGHIQVEELRGKDVWVSLGGLDEPQVTDTDLVYLEAFPRLYSLWLTSTRVTDAGLEHLRGAVRLHFLHLAFTNVTDKGLPQLRGLARLEDLDLTGTKVTDAGLEHLKALPQLRQLRLACTQVTDAGLKHLRVLLYLRDLDLQDTHVTSEGVKSLQQALPKCKIVWQPSVCR